MKTIKKIKPPFFAELLLKQFLRQNDATHRLGDFEEAYHLKEKISGRIRAKTWYWAQVFLSLPDLINNSIYWSAAMLKNYIKVAFRNIARYKLYSFINIFGLGIGIAACLMIYLWVQKELSYDDFHKNGHRIYRIERELFRDNLYSRWPICSGAYQQALIDDYAEIENAVRFWRREFSIKDHKDVVHRQATFAVDNSIFDIFNFKLEEGDKSSALTEPMTVVLTHNEALKYFGTYDVIGKSLTFEWENKPVDFKVTGIIREVPENSHIHFKMLISISSYPKERFSNWRSNYLYTYVLVNENISKLILEDMLKSFTSNRLEPYYGDLLGGDAKIHDVLKLYLFPLRNIHLYPSINWELEIGGSIFSVYIFSSIAILILIIACLNFMNLSTARASKRAKEVGLRKTIGANNNQLKLQFIQESVLLAAIALLLAIIILTIFVPVFNSVFSEKISIYYLLQPQNIVILIFTTIAAGFFSGLYPAFYLTKFEPAGILKTSILSKGSKSAFRKNMVIIQFVISITLIVGMFTIYNQMNFIQNRSLGYDKENVVVIPVQSQNVSVNYESYRNELLSDSRIISVSASADVPSDRIYGDTNYRLPSNQDKAFSMTNIFTDYDFFDTYKIDVIAGRAFSKDFGTDTLGTIMLNEAAVKKIGWTPEEAIGKELLHRSNNKSNIVGVVKNFNFKSVHTKIEPLVILLAHEYISYFSVRVIPGDIDFTLNFLKEKWQNIFPGEQFEHSFLDDRLSLLYEREKKMQNIFLLFSFLSLFVACLGLFGLAVFSTEERTKEIGIRKVLGASIPDIFSLLLKEFVKWVIISTVIACPIAWFAMNKWLQNFVYRIDIGLWVFILAGCIALMIALLTVSSQAIKAAIANPIDSLKYE